MIHSRMFFILCCILFISNVKCEMFTSIEQMTMLVSTHEQVTKHLKDLIDTQNQNLDMAKL